MLYGKKPLGTIGYLGGLMALAEPFCWSFSQMIQYNNDYVCMENESIHYNRAMISFHAAARNYLVDNMLGDWLLQLDTDVTFDPDLLARMLMVFNRPIDTGQQIDVLAGLYQHKAAPHHPVIYTWTEDKKNLVHLGDWEKYDEGHFVIPIASAGAGALLVRRTVFDRIKKELKESPFDITHPYGEDHSFFLRLNKLGIKAYCDPLITVNHLRLDPITMDDYQRDDVVIDRTIKGEI